MRMPNTAIGKLTKAVMSEYKIGKIIIIAIEHANRINEYNVGRTVLGKDKEKIHSVCD
jgi:hypothetical protein